MTPRTTAAIATGATTGPGKWKLMPGSVWWAILTAAEENDVRAIVLGSRGHSHVGAVLGSVAYHVVHNATRPVP